MQVLVALLLTTLGDVVLCSVSLVMTMMIRDEAVNIKSNLALWLPSIDYFVFLVDERTKDDSKIAIASILEGKAMGYKIIDYTFEGFGQARTMSLDRAYEHFPQATHVWIADPDWRPEASTIVKNDLDMNHDAYR